MRQIIIGKNEEGQRLDRILIRLFPNAGKGFIFKMLRKKNIVLNGKKAEGNERLNPGDELKLFFSEETLIKISGLGKIDNTEINNTKNDIQKKLDEENEALKYISHFAEELSEMVIYEDEDVIILNKPKGILSQKAGKEDISLNEMLIAYMLQKNEIDEKQLTTFKPSMCNRLDRNTQGLICGGKTLMGLRVLSTLFRSRDIDKFYLCIVMGIVKKSERIEGYLEKDKRTNTVSIRSNIDTDDTAFNAETKIMTEYKPLEYYDNCTLLEVKLLTGKTHQIRAHLASIGHPIAGDIKYGNEVFNKRIYDKYKINSQMLFAYRLRFPKECGELKKLNNKEIILEKPREFLLFKS